MNKQTKSEPVNKELVDFMMEQFAKIDERFDEIQEKIVEFKDGAYDKMDAVYKEVLAFRDEEVMYQAGQDRLQDAVDDHEKRIGKLEESHTTAHQIKK